MGSSDTLGYCEYIIFRSWTRRSSGCSINLHHHLKVKYYNVTTTLEETSLNYSLGVVSSYEPELCGLIVIHLTSFLGPYLPLSFTRQLWDNFGKRSCEMTTSWGEQRGRECRGRRMKS